MSDLSDATYEVRISGLVPIQQLLDEVGCLQDGRQEVHTVLSGRFPDRATLYAVLHQLRSCGLEVVDVRRVTEPEAPRLLGEVAMPFGELPVVYGEASA